MHRALNLQGANNWYATAVITRRSRNTGLIRSSSAGFIQIAMYDFSRIPFALQIAPNDLR